MESSAGVKAEEAALGNLLEHEALRVGGVRGIARQGRGSGARELIDERGCTSLLSFGVSGAITEALVPGDIALARAIVMSDGERIATSPEMQLPLREAAAAAGACSEACRYGRCRKRGLKR